VLRLSPSGIQYQWVFVGITAAICVITYLFVQRLTSAPLGRTLRAIRENEAVAAALGKNVTAKRLLAFTIGGAIAAVSGGLLAEQITAWSPAGWQFPETFSFFAAVIIGGAGNNLGVLIGALLVPVGFVEAARYLPTIGNAQLVGAMQWILIGLLIVIFMWFRPRGLLPERRRTFPAGR
jgi:branched-chain amino acid transport system permease protein